jgi:hypothetical protein
MKIVSYQRRTLQRRSFARHIMTLMNGNPSAFPLIWIRNKHFLILKADKTPECRVLRNPIFLAF